MQRPKAQMTIKIQWLILSLSLFVLPGFLASMNIAQGAEVYAVAVNPSISEQTISRNALRAILGMRLQVWPDGNPIKVFVLPDDDPIHTGFSKEVINVFPYQLRAAWDRLVFSGTGQAPIEVRTEEEMRIKIAATPGAIGYLREAMVNDQVHVLQIK